MWEKIAKHMHEYPSAVLSSVGPDGFPYSLRCQAKPDLDNRVLRLEVPAWVRLKAGPASLLFHQHDDHLRDLSSFMVRGFVESGNREWTFRPARLVPGQGFDKGMLGFLRYALRGKRRAKRYFESHGLSAPKIPWEEIKALVEEISVPALDER